MIRKCFTINQHRTTNDFLDYENYLIKTKKFQGCEIFYPYDIEEYKKNIYIQNVKNLMKYEDFEIVCHLPHGVNNNLASKINIEQTMKRMKDAIIFSSLFKVKKLTLHPGFVDELSIKDSIIESISNIKELAKFSKKYNMYIMIENLVGDNELCTNEFEMKYLIDSINEDNVCLIFDCGHCHVEKDNKPTIEGFIKILESKLMHIHISDNDGTFDSHGPIGSGTIDFKSYFKLLKDINYKGLYCFEVLFNNYKDLLKTSNDFDEIVNSL